MKRPRVLAFILGSTAVLLAGCGTRTPQIAATSTKPIATSGAGKYYLDDGPPDVAPESLESTPDATPRAEPLHRFANRAYVVFGRTYQPHTTITPFSQTGMASWYGRKFHGQKTAIGEIYDMFSMTAAHPTAPLPSYMRVTNLENGRSAVVRVNDRGPFLHDRIIDLSYAAAAKLGYARKGSARVSIALLDQGVSSVVQPVFVAPALQPASTVSTDDGQVFFVQIAAFGSESNAISFVNQVRERVSELTGFAPQLQTRDAMSRVRIGPFASRAAATLASEALQQKMGINSRVGK